MAFLLLALAIIRRLYALGTLLESRFKCLSLLFKSVLCRKLTSTCRLWYRRGPVVSKQPRPAQSFCTQENLPPVGSLNFGGPAAASSVPTQSSRRSSSTSRAPTQILIPLVDVGHSTPTLSPNSRQGYSTSMPVSTGISQISCVMSPEPAEDIHWRIDITPPTPGEFDGEKSRPGLRIPLLLLLLAQDLRKSVYHHPYTQLHHRLLFLPIKLLSQ